MKTGIALAFICLGAILAFAVTANTSVFNINTAGWVIMLIGLVGLFLPRRNRAWLGRRVVVRRTRAYPDGPDGPVEEIPVPPYVARNPGTQALEAGLPSRPTLLDQEDDLIEQAESGYDVIQETEPDGYHAQGRVVQEARPQPGTAGPQSGSTEVIEDLYEQP